MGEQYDQLAAQYESYAKHSTFKPVERFNFFSHLGELCGESILDLACGFGYYTRLIKAHGAGKLIGIDISEGMIDLAREHEAKLPMGIDYQVADCANLPDLGEFDAVTAIWLLNNAPDRACLKGMIDSVYRQLKPGGRFVGITFFPEFDISKSNFGKYGVEISGQKFIGEQWEIEGFFHTAEGPTKPITVYQWSRDTQNELFKAAGFSKVTWAPIEVPPLQIEKYGAEYWEDFANNNGICLIAER
ncbi:MAG: class I SAM-dependent methyltransferase [Verrucomicrobiota bacterium]